MDKVVHFEIMEYTLIQTMSVDENHMPTEPGAINGGMMKRQDPVKCPIITIAVENIEDAFKNVKKMGGELVRGKTQVGDMGYTAYFKDTEGNVIGLWQNIS